MICQLNKGPIFFGLANEATDSREAVAAKLTRTYMSYSKEVKEGTGLSCVWFSSHASVETLTPEWEKEWQKKQKKKQLGRPVALQAAEEVVYY